MTAHDTAVLISIRPEWSALIQDGKKTIEVRKNRPKLEPPFTVYIYQTKPKWGDWNERDGHIVGEFTCKEIRLYPAPELMEDSKALNDLYWRGLLKTSDIWDYSGGKTKDLFGWVISDLRVYDKPLKLSELARLDGQPVKRPPQSWGYVARRNQP